MCSVTECNYLTVDEAMLRYHLKALHSEEPYFRCPHCPAPLQGQESQNIAIDKMGVHLKMHDTRLYKCSHCNHHHYHRFVNVYVIVRPCRIALPSKLFYEHSHFTHNITILKHVTSMTSLIIN